MQFLKNEFRKMQMNLDKMLVSQLEAIKSVSTGKEDYHFRIRWREKAQYP